MTKRRKAEDKIQFLPKEKIHRAIIRKHHRDHWSKKWRSFKSLSRV